MNNFGIVHCTMKVCTLYIFLAMVATGLAQPEADFNVDQEDRVFVIIDNLLQLLNKTKEDYLIPRYDKSEVILVHTKHDLIDSEMDRIKNLKREAGRNYGDEAKLVECIHSLDQKSHENLKNHIEDLENAFDDFNKLSEAHHNLIVNAAVLKIKLLNLFHYCSEIPTPALAVCKATWKSIRTKIDAWRNKAVRFIEARERESSPDFDNFRESVSSIKAHFDTSFDELLRETRQCFTVSKVEVHENDRYEMWPH